MSIITKMLKQTAVYWPPTGADEFGQPTWDEPEEIACRWEGVAEEFIDAVGDKQLSAAKVFVGQDVKIQGVLMLGELTDLESGGEPKGNEGAWEILQFSKIPNLKNTEYLRIAYLGMSVRRK